MHEITVDRIKHMMDVLSKSMSEFKPETEMHEFGFVQDTYLLLSEQNCKTCLCSRKCLVY